jgi:integrase/recombinase XerD
VVYVRTAAQLSEVARVGVVVGSSRGPQEFPSERARFQRRSEVPMPSNTKAATISGGQLRHLLRVTDATSRAPERDRLVLLLGLTGAMRVTEIARVLVEDVLLPSRAVRPEVSLRAAITKGCRQRCVFLTHGDTRQALDAYIEWRWDKGFGTELDRRRYRGLSPATPLIVTRRGAGFALNRKPRTLAGGEVEDYLACDALQAHVSGLYRAAGLAECSSHTRVLQPYRTAHVRQPAAGQGPRSRGDPAAARPCRPGPH